MNDEFNKEVTKQDSDPTASPLEHGTRVEPARETESMAAAADTTQDAPPPAGVPLSPEQERVKNLVVTVIRTVFDPEIPVNIYELGLIYGIDVSPENDVKVRFTLTSPNCPAAQDLPMEMERKIKALDGVGKVEMALTWEPTWNPEMMTEAAKLQLNMF